MTKNDSVKRVSDCVLSMTKNDSVKRVIVWRDSILRKLLPVPTRYSIAFWKCVLILLGAGVAHGFLHGLPTPCCNTIGMYVLNSLYLKHNEFETLIFHRFFTNFQQFQYSSNEILELAIWLQWLRHFSVYSLLAVDPSTTFIFIKCLGCEHGDRKRQLGQWSSL